MAVEQVSIITKTPLEVKEVLGGATEQGLGLVEASIDSDPAATQLAIETLQEEVLELQSEVAALQAEVGSTWKTTKLLVTRGGEGPDVVEILSGPDNYTATWTDEYLELFNADATPMRRFVMKLFPPTDPMADNNGPSLTVNTLVGNAEALAKIANKTILASLSFGDTYFEAVNFLAETTVVYIEITQMIAEEEEEA